MSTIERDNKILDSLGGTTKVAKLLGLEGHGPQRVNNWRYRGIPAHIKVKHPAIFMPELLQATASTAQAAAEPVAQS